MSAVYGGELSEKDGERIRDSGPACECNLRNAS